MSGPWPIPRKLLFRPSEVAELLGYSTRTVQRHMIEGAFGSLWQKDNQRRVTYGGLKAYLEGNLEDQGQEKK